MSASPKAVEIAEAVLDLLESKQILPRNYLAEIIQGVMDRNDVFSYEKKLASWRGKGLPNDEEKPFNPKHCINCGAYLLDVDRSPNGDPNCVCAKCRAEESHDFDREPNAVFDRCGRRVK